MALTPPGCTLALNPPGSLLIVVPKDLHPSGLHINDCEIKIVAYG